MNEDLKCILSLVAIVLVSTGYWKQVWHIHKHKEVRDLDPWGYVSMDVGFMVLMYIAYSENSTVFVLKQLSSLIPCCIIVWQCKVHSKDEWED